MSFIFFLIIFSFTRRLFICTFSVLLFYCHICSRSFSFCSLFLVVESPFLIFLIIIFWLRLSFSLFIFFLSFSFLFIHFISSIDINTFAIFNTCPLVHFYLSLYLYYFFVYCLIFPYFFLSHVLYYFRISLYLYYHLFSFLISSFLLYLCH